MKNESMKNKREEKQRKGLGNVLMLTEEDIDTQPCYRHLTPEQKSELIALIYEISLVLYNSYFENNEST